MDDNNLKQKEKDNDEELKSFSPILDSSFDSSESISGKLEYNFISTLTPDDFSGNKNKIRKSTSPNKLGLQKKDNKVNGNINHKRLIFKKRERPRKQKSKVDKISMNITHNTPGTSQSTSDVPEASQDNYVPYLQETIRRYLTNEEPPLLSYFPITINGTPDMPGTSQAFCEEPLLIPFTSLNTNAISNEHNKSSEVQDESYIYLSTLFNHPQQTIYSQSSFYFNDSDLFTEVSNSIFWSNALEARLCELYMKDDVVDIFWGQPVENHLIGSTNWHVYVIIRGLHNSYAKTEITADNQVINFIAEEERLISFDEPLPNPLKIPQDLKEKFNEALDNELRSSFRDVHYNLVGIGTGYKQIRGKFTEIPAIIFYIRQKGILRRGCDGLLPKKIRGFPTDVIEACVAIPCAGLGVDTCRRYQENVKLGSSIGIKSEKNNTTGTLSAVAHENYPPYRIGIISCEHVLKFNESNSEKKITIYQPSYNDLFEPKGKLEELLKNAGLSTCLEGTYNYQELKDFDYNNKVFKVGRTTGLTLGQLLPTDQAIACSLTNESIKNAKILAMEKNIPCYSNADQKIFIGYMKSRLDSEICQKRKKCYPVKWFDRQLAFQFEPGEFECGDSGASVLDKQGKALGILHAKLRIPNQTFGIASPYFAILEALDVSIYLSSNPVKPTITSPSIISPPPSYLSLPFSNNNDCERVSPPPSYLFSNNKNNCERITLPPSYLFSNVQNDCSRVNKRDMDINVETDNNPKRGKINQKEP